ncbi:MAG: metal-dependent transcriptional regulator [Deltaproteobacteria bacterium]|nr:metal-dependent transcriptional regulator [Deltaproteobacteria bacterium]
MAKMKIELSESLEDYLEIILALEKTSKVARVKDISEKMGVMRGSVTGALKSLADKDLINYEPYSYITLTRKGATIAREITRRHGVIKDFLQNVLLLDSDEAEKNACRMEHAMEKIAVDRLVKFLEYIHNCPRTGDDWLEAFVNYYSKDELDTNECEDCLKNCVDRYTERIIS